MNIAAVYTAPFNFFISFKRLSFFNFLKKCFISFFMMLLSICNHFIHCCNILKAFFSCHFCKFLINICPLLVLSFCCSFKIFYSRTDNSGRIHCCDLYHSTFKEFEHPFCMFLFLIRCFFKNYSYFFITVFFCLFCPVGVTHSCL